jgi:WD40 repeat protein
MVSIHDLDTLARAATVDAGRAEVGVRYRPDGAQLALALSSGFPTGDGEGVLLVDAETLEPAAVQLGGLPPNRLRTAVTYSADGSYLAVSTDGPVGENGVLVWRLSNPQAPILSIDVGGTAVPAVALSPDGSRLYVWQNSDAGGPLRAYNVADGRLTHQTDTARSTNDMGQGSPNEMEISPDGATLALASRGDLVLIDTRTLTERDRIRDTSEFDTGPFSVTFSHDGELIAAAGQPWNGEPVVVWDVATLQAHRTLDVAEAVAVAFSPDDRTIFTASTHGLAEWKVGPNRAFVDVITEPRGTARIGRVAPSPDGTAVAYLGEARVRFLDPDRNELVEGPEVRGQEVAWRPPEFDTVAVAEGYGLSLVDRHSGESIAERVGAVASIGFTADGDRLLVGNDNGEIIALDGDSLDPEGPRLDLVGSIRGLFTSADGERAVALAGGGGSGYAVIDLPDAVVVEEGDLGFGHAAGAISPDGTRLAVAGVEGEVGVRRLDGPGWVRPPIEGAVEVPRAVSFSPDGTTFVISDASGQVHLWDATTGTPLARLAPRPGFGARAGFADEHTVVVATNDGGVYRWDTSLEAAIDAACKVAGRNMTPAEWREVFPDRPHRETCPAG